MPDSFQDTCACLPCVEFAMDKLDLPCLSLTSGLDPFASKRRTVSTCSPSTCITAHHSIIAIRLTASQQTSMESTLSLFFRRPSHHALDGLRCHFCCLSLKGTTNICCTRRSVLDHIADKQTRRIIRQDGCKPTVVAMHHQEAALLCLSVLPQKQSATETSLSRRCISSMSEVSSKCCEDLALTSPPDLTSTRQISDSPDMAA
eukprot:762616-Hanusia_phi.AAC.9